MIRGSFVFVSNLPTGVTEEEIRDLFGTVGEVVNVRLEYDVRTNRPTGSGFVQLSDDQGAKNAVERLNGIDFQVMREAEYIRDMAHALRVNHSKKLSRPLDAGPPTARSETLIKVAGFVKRRNSNGESVVSENGQSSFGDPDPDRRFLASTKDSPEAAVPEEPTPPFQRNTISRRSFTFNNLATQKASDVQMPHVFPRKEGHTSGSAYYSTSENDETVYHVGRLETSFTSDDVPPLLERYDSLRPSAKHVDATEDAATNPLGELGEVNSGHHEYTWTESPIRSTHIAYGTPAAFEDSRNEQRFTVHQNGNPEKIVSTTGQSRYDPESLSRITECSEETVAYQHVSTPGRRLVVADVMKGKLSNLETSGEQRLIIYATGRPQQATVGASPSAFSVGNDTASWIADLVKQAPAAPPTSQPVEPFTNSVELPSQLSTARVKPMDQRGIIQASARPTNTTVPVASPPGSPKKERRSHGLMKLLNRNKHKVAEPYSGPIRYWYRTSVMREEPIEQYVNVYHSGRSDEPTTVSNNAKVHGDELTRSQITRYFKNATTLQDYPVSKLYVGPLLVKRKGHEEINEEPLVHHVTVYHSGRSDEPPSISDEVPSSDYHSASHKNSGRLLKKHADNKKYHPPRAYQGPVYTYRNTDFHCVPLEHYVTVYHHGRSDEPDLPI